MVNGKYLLDTNIVSDGSKISPSQNVKDKLDLFCNSCKISAITWYELQKGIKRMNDGKKKEFLKDYVQEQVFQLYEILPYNKECADIQSDVYSKMEKNGSPIPYQDAQIAATALANNLVLVTRNTKDFLSIQAFFPLKLENWFE